MIVAGVDVGSTTSKAVVLDDRRQIAGTSLLPTGANVVRAAERAFREALAASKRDESEAAYVIGTGYGRYKVAFGDDQVTEIGCHARGAQFLFPDTRTIVDIGGQDTKAIRISDRGEVLDFSMNDKCAAGTGRFLDACANVIGMTLDEIGPASMNAQKPIRITNVCTVFVESEIIAHLARGETVEDILRGVHLAIGSRTAGLVRRVGTNPAVTFTGGVSRNVGMVQALEERLGVSVHVSPLSQWMGALGAALIALERVEGGAVHRIATGSAA